MKEDILKSIPCVFKHHSGSLYQLIGVSNLTATKDSFTKQAIYVDQQCILWSRPIDDFLNKFEKTDITPWACIL